MNSSELDGGEYKWGRHARFSAALSLFFPQHLSLPASVQGGLKNPALASIHHILTAHNMTLDLFKKCLQMFFTSDLFLKTIFLQSWWCAMKIHPFAVHLALRMLLDGMIDSYRKCCFPLHSFSTLCGSIFDLHMSYDAESLSDCGSIAALSAPDTLPFAEVYHISLCLLPQRDATF